MAISLSKETGLTEDRYSSIRRIILACMILIPFIPFISVLATGYHYFKTSLENSTAAGMKRIVADHRQMIETFLDERQADLVFAQQAFSFAELSQPRNLEKVFLLLCRSSQAFVDVGVFDKTGLHVSYEGPYPLQGKVYDQYDWFQKVLERKYYISDIFLGYRNVPHFIIAVADAERGRPWVLRATIDSQVFDNLVKKIHIGATGEAYILNAEGLLQTERRSGGDLMTLAADFPLQREQQEDIRFFSRKDAGGRDFLYVTAWLKNKPWQLVVRLEKADAFKALRTATCLIVIISVAGGGLIISAALYLTRRIIRRMQQLDDEKDRLNQQLIHAGRLAELGEMAAGFAHEVNNPLQIIKNELALVEMLMEKMKAAGALVPGENSAEIEDSFRQIDLQISRCGQITQAILKFARKGEAGRQRLALNHFLPEAITLVANRADAHDISVKLNVANESLVVYADPVELQQVILNLLNNAVDAVIATHADGGGEISVEAAASTGRLICIRVRDNGCGITPENLPKIFSPFFTTKPAGKGTGLGLSVCYGLVNGMGGSMQAESNPGTQPGTTFTVILPADLG